ncbi:MAG: hypothetical protein JNL18_12710 [Planctomycetaceae bacterium]|jgi:hypothetical protein|uniref:Uncharacterized protein n=1 Tax=Lacipirellula limnantheis TaxID=2528024 RepID=A0A517TWT4_9BACT|nr:hypothetical protein [Lacipirellula limnantheis]MBL9163587.1 hypothetical protein [Planctomycetaceae bacterium]QDT72835.1 hypothetical protein I41_20200 [Lacipirellula limnantheis]
MLRDTNAFDLSAAPVLFGTAQPSHQGSPAPVVAPADARLIEQEIARLTWAVLDGGATLTDRQRLAELVNAQHQQRRRFDR